MQAALPTLTLTRTLTLTLTLTLILILTPTLILTSALTLTLTRCKLLQKMMDELMALPEFASSPEVGAFLFG